MARLEHCGAAVAQLGVMGSGRVCGDVVAGVSDSVAPGEGVGESVGDMSKGGSGRVGVEGGGVLELVVVDGLVGAGDVRAMGAQ